MWVACKRLPTTACSNVRAGALWDPELHIVAVAASTAPASAPLDLLILQLVDGVHGVSADGVGSASSVSTMNATSPCKQSPDTLCETPLRKSKQPLRTA